MFFHWSFKIDIPAIENEQEIDRTCDSRVWMDLEICCQEDHVKADDEFNRA